MSPTPAGSDPWADVPKCQCEGVAVYVAKDVDRARAAVEAQHAREMQAVCDGRDAERARCQAVYLDLAALRQRAETAEAEIASLTRQVNALRTGLHDICEEWNEGCEPGCDSYGHLETCKGANIVAAKKALRERAEKAEAETAKLEHAATALGQQWRETAKERDKLQLRAEQAEAEIAALRAKELQP